MNGLPGSKGSVGKLEALDGRLGVGAEILTVSQMVVYSLAYPLGF